MSDLARRVQIVRDTDEIENLVSMYGYYLDKQQWDLFTELFSENSQMEISQRGIYYGKKGVRRAVELFGPQNHREGSPAQPHPAAAAHHDLGRWPARLGARPRAQHARHVQAGGRVGRWRVRK